jgi:hypothetical protein
VLFLVGVAMGLWGASPAGALPRAGSPLVAVPVVSCHVEFGAQVTPPAWAPSSLPVAFPARTAARVTFYSDGFVAALGPKGWSCSGLEAADGGQSLSVFPAGQPNPLSAQARPAHAAGVTIVLDYTGHGPGAELVCGLFPGTRAAAFARSTGGCPALPRAERVRRPTPDVATFADPAGVKGSGVPSGGQNPSFGVVIFPQLRPEPGSVNVAQASCTLPSASSALCGLILGDFVARELPTQTMS